MTKEQIRAQLSIFFLSEMKSLLSKDPEIQFINAKIILVEKPDYKKAGTFTIKIIKNKE